MCRLHRSASSSTDAKTKIFSNWRTVREIVTPGDVNGGGKGGLIVRRAGTGDIPQLVRVQPADHTG
ncbi:hypothetical protein OHB07_25730 [Streptomyces sp. NBC_00111]|uniref:hypothetical protein n=1 Tax=Streptomyces sp. NBC_00111 TaxID=2975655 RepID=UPI00324B1801